MLDEFCSDLVLVHGDNTTTIQPRRWAFYKKIPVGHIEAGLRTGDIYSPWPEEVNRKVAGVVAQLHFAPTEMASNLRKEAVPNNRIIVTGNTVIDALLSVVNKLEEDTDQSNALDAHLGIDLVSV